MATTHEVLEKLREKADRKQIGNVDELKRLLKEEILSILTTTDSQPLTKVDGTPEVILVVGVNGTGKTTTIGKLAQVLRSDGKTVLLCAADTFRAAAIEQLEVWGQRTGTEVIRTKAGGDPSAVLYDALQAATARHTDYVIVDTAGRLHTKTNLMAELEKMRRTAQRIIPDAPHERHHRTEWSATGAAIHTIRGRDRHRADQARWHGQGRSGGCYIPRARCSGALCWGRRKGGRPFAL
jgi:fused signal recognition particle receptor